MKPGIYMDREKFAEREFSKEEDFENLIINESKILFGVNTIYFNLKNKIKSQSLGDSIPDGFLFDFTDKENPEFYLVEVELAKHDFFKHIFPQITKFFAFFKNTKSLNELVEILFNHIKLNSALEQEFKLYLGRGEIYKDIKEIIENSQNILIMIDENKPEFQEIMETYTDTWDKMVKIEVLKQYVANNKSIFYLQPDFRAIEFAEPLAQGELEERYTENFHLEGKKEDIQKLYQIIKETILKLFPNVKINPQRWYISLRENRNFAYIEIKKKKIHLIIMLSYETGVNLLKKHKIIQLPDSIQNFYNNPCFKLTLENSTNLDEVIKTLEEAYKQQNK